MRYFQILAALFLCSVPVAAQWNQNGRPVPDTPSRKSKDGFGAALVLTDDPHTFVDEWQSTPPEHKPEIPMVDRAPRNRQVVAFVLFSGCRPRNGACDCSVDFTVLRPDQSTYAELHGLDLWHGSPPTPDNYL